MTPRRVHASRKKISSAVSAEAGKKEWRVLEGDTGGRTK